MLPLQFVLLPAFLVLRLPFFQLSTLPLLGQALQFCYLVLIPPDLFLEGLQRGQDLSPGGGDFVELLRAGQQTLHVLSLRIHFLPPLYHLSFPMLLGQQLALHPLRLFPFQVHLELQQPLDVALVTLG